MTSNHCPQELILSGTVVASGMAWGSAHLFFNTNIHSPLEKDASSQTEGGWKQIDAAIQERLGNLAHRIGQGGFSDDSVAISMLQAYQIFLRDPLLHTSLQDELLKNGDRPALAIQATCQKWITNFEQISGGHMQPKALLIADLGKMLLDSLADSPAKEPLTLTQKHILVADHLFVSDTVALHQMRPAAIVVEHGHPASHGLILARELEIPILCQVHGITRFAHLGTPLVVDADRSRVIVHPAQPIEINTPLPQKKPTADQPLAFEKTPVRVMADLGCVAAAVRAKDAGADGIGLLRMESLYIPSNHPLQAEEIEQRLADILLPMAGKPACVRLLDAGGDKPLPYIKDSLGGSAMTGYRGIRLLAAHPELLRPQLQALLRLSQHFDLSILVPMVTVAEDMRLVREALEAEARREGIPPPPLGAMIETPAAALMVDPLWEWSDFMRIGSNDLTQYTLAASRANPLAEGYYQQTHPAVLKLIAMVCRSEEPELIGLCGALANREDMLPQLLQLGIREFTVPPRSIDAIKQAVMRASSSGHSRTTHAKITLD